MARVARSTEPLYQTRGRPLSFPIALTNPDGSAVDLTGATALATLFCGQTPVGLSVSTPDATGKLVVTGAASLTASIGLGNLNALAVTVTDSLGVDTDYEWPVIGETVP